ncbi:MAG: FAD-dependent oxidoreductase, partial [Planctomycetota bacterium]|nr:FAD-dependent oxidoreductase [Planctomycetota bacterium]
MTAWGIGLCALALLVSAAGATPSLAWAGEDTAVVRESARKIPVAYEVDVVVVGGGAGAVAAAQAAAQNGAKVFLAAPRTYLGEDIAGTLRVWAASGEKLSTPLAEKLFGAEGREAGGATEIKHKLPFTYKADKPSAAQHKDTSPPSALSDGKWHSAVTQSVQYDGEVTLVADLGTAQQIEKAGVMAYHAKDFLVESVAVATGDDGKEWKEAAAIRNSAPQGTETSPALALSTAVSTKARYVRFHVKPAGESKRVLIGEIILTGPEDKTAPAPETAPAVHLIRPLHIKRTLDEALLGAGVQFLYGCYACDVLRDAQGNPSGIVMANRAGRQAVVAKVIVDATERAWVARMAGARSKPFPAGMQAFERVVVGGEMRTGDNLSGRKLPVGFAGRPVLDYALKIEMADGSYPAWARAEQTARTMTYHEDQESAADFLFQVPPDAIEAAKPAAGDWTGVGGLELDAFKPAGVERVFILGGCADIPRPQAEKLLQPPALVEMGARIGVAAAALAKSLPPPRDVRLAGKPAPEGGGDVKEILTGVRATQSLPTIEQTARGLPVLGRYDVVVVGGGTSGAPAGIAAARQGAKTLVLEYQCALGGVGTIGLISTYYWGNCVGFTKEVLGGAGKWKVEQKAEWWRSTLLKAGAEIWFGAMGCGAYVEGGRVRGAVVATPQGRGVVLAKVVIDATGNADVAAAAGAACVTTDATDVAQQGTGLPPRHLGQNYTNTDYTIVDETDMLDVWQILVYGKQMAGTAFDFGTLIDTLERRRIVGDFTITILDEVLDRTYPDTILQARSNFDTHGYTVDPYFTLNFPHHKGLVTNVPYRALLPQG